MMAGMLMLPLVGTSVVPAQAQSLAQSLAQTITKPVLGRALTQRMYDASRPLASDSKEVREVRAAYADTVRTTMQAARIYDGLQPQLEASTNYLENFIALGQGTHAARPSSITVDYPRADTVVVKSADGRQEMSQKLNFGSEAVRTRFQGQERTLMTERRALDRLAETSDWNLRTNLQVTLSDGRAVTTTRQGEWRTINVPVDHFMATTVPGSFLFSWDGGKSSTTVEGGTVTVKRADDVQETYRMGRDGSVQYERTNAAGAVVRSVTLPPR